VRAIVYGLLLAIGVLVLAARPSSPSEGPIRNLRTLRGTTGQRGIVWINMRDRHVRSVFVNHVVPACGRAVSWQPTIGQQRVYYHERDDRIELTELWRGPRAEMHARVYNGGHNLDGTISFTWGRCAGNPIRFSVSG
jgi:hypothetical protein